MNITAKRTELLSATKWVGRAIPKRPSLPVLAGIKITADDAEVRVSAFDYDTSLTARVAVEVAGPGQLLVSGAAFASFLSAARAAEVSIRTEGTSALLHCGSASLRLPTMSLDDYPDLPESDAGTRYGEIDADALAWALGAVGVLSARDYDPALPFASCVRLSASDEQLSLLAGTRYALGETRVPSTLEPFTALVTTGALRDVVQDLRGAVSIRESAGLLVVSTENRTATLRLAAAEFPSAVDGLLSTPGTATVRIDREALIESVKLVATSSDRVRIDVAAAEVELSTHTPEKGESLGDITDSVGCEAEGATGSIYAAAHYLLACLSGISRETAEIQLTPGSAKAATLADERSRFVFMTLRQPS